MIKPKDTLCHCPKIQWTLLEDTVCEAQSYSAIANSTHQASINATPQISDHIGPSGQMEQRPAPAHSMVLLGERPPITLQFACLTHSFHAPAAVHSAKDSIPMLRSA